VLVPPSPAPEPIEPLLAPDAVPEPEPEPPPPELLAPELLPALALFPLPEPLLDALPLPLPDAPPLEAAPVAPVAPMVALEPAQPAANTNARPEPRIAVASPFIASYLPLPPQR
jgi:hypothetical protein